MSHMVKREHVFFAFGPASAPVLAVEQGEEIVIETHDCFQGHLRSEADPLGDVDWNHVNPATGPIYVRGARAGDVLRVDILDVKVGDQSIMVAAPGEGALGDVLDGSETIVVRHVGSDVLVRDRFRIPMRPMIGVIGVAPAAGAVSTGTPGPHGGNMDCTLIGSGASVYFTVGVDGALLGVGDLHSAMGDGEVMICGAETSGEVTLRAQVVDAPGLPTPFVRKGDVVAAIYSSPTIDDAVTGATHAMARFLADAVGLRMNDAAMLMSLVGSLRFCQVVDPEKTVRFEFPVWVLEQCGFRLP